MTNRIMELADRYAEAYNPMTDIGDEGEARAALEAEIDRVCKDSEKYKWLCDRPQWLGWDQDFNARDIDAIVTRAMQGEKS